MNGTIAANLSCHQVDQLTRGLVLLRRDIQQGSPRRQRLSFPDLRRFLRKVRWNDDFGVFDAVGIIVYAL